MSEKLLKVTGYGEAIAGTDYIEINITLTSNNYIYEEVLEELETKTKILKDNLKNVGFNEDDIKTTDFYINPNYDYINGEQIFNGYIGTHKLTIGFDYNLEKLNQTISTLGNSKSLPSFTIVFKVKDENALENLAISSAIIDATDKAKHIAKDLELTLNNINQVTYNNYPTTYKSVSYENDNEINNLNITPQDITYKTSIYIEWNI